MNWHKENCLVKEGVGVERVGPVVLDCRCSTQFKGNQGIADWVGFVGM